MMKFNRLYSGLYYSECNDYQIERKDGAWVLSTKIAPADCMYREHLATYRTLAECKEHAERHAADSRSPFGLRACAESIQFSRDVLKQSAAEIIADLYRSEELNGVFFNRTMFDGFDKVFPEFPICRETLREYWAVASTSEDNLTDAAAHMVRLVEADLVEETPAEEPAHTLTAMTCADLDKVNRLYARKMREHVADLEWEYTNTREATPAETVAAFVASVGYDAAVAAVATLVNRYAWDGRISPKVAEWAARIPSAFASDAAVELFIYSDRIHRTHLDQIAEALMQYTPEQEPETVTESAPALVASDAPVYSCRITCTATGEMIEALRVSPDLDRVRRIAAHYVGTLTGECVVELQLVGRDGSRYPFSTYTETPATPTTTTAPEAEKESETMTSYNYLTATTANVVEYIRDQIDYIRDDVDISDRDALAEFLNDELWVDDGVTGNASGSYTFNRARAREYVLADFDTVAEALREFDCDHATTGRKFIEEDWEYFDVTARCYVFGQAIEAALDQLAEELTYAE